MIIAVFPHNGVAHWGDASTHQTPHAQSKGYRSWQEATRDAIEQCRLLGVEVEHVTGRAHKGTARELGVRFRDSRGAQRRSDAVDVASRLRWIYRRTRSGEVDEERFIREVLDAISSRL